MTEEAKSREQRSNTRVISEFVEGEALFDSAGYSVIKITRRGVDDKGRKKNIQELVYLPITSMGIMELQEALSAKAPKPPVRFETVRKDSPEGQSMGLTHDRVCYVFDSTDERYIAAFTEWSREMTWQVVIASLDVSWKNKDGAPCATYEEKKAVLQRIGIARAHLDKIMADVRSLTELRREQEDFLAGN